MYIKSLLGAISTCVITLVYANLSEAALIDRGGGLIYDDVLNITWMQDSNYAFTQFVNTGGLLGDGDGRMTWWEASEWAANLTYYDSVRDVTYNGWRLPKSSPVNGVSFNMNSSSDGTTDKGYAGNTGWVDSAGIPVSELGHLYYVSLGNLGYCNPNLPYCTEQIVWETKNTGPFSDFTFERRYWSSGEADDTTALQLQSSNGARGKVFKTNTLYPWVVRDGDVNAVPILAAIWLFSSGLIGLIGIARRKKL